VRLTNGPLFVLGDPDRLHQIFFNLLSNAVKFTPRGGEITIRAEHTTAHAQITVSDTGQGIRAEFLPHIFERFKQADSSITRQYSGLGLGLAIAQHLIKQHGGTIDAYSEGEGRGARFTVNLPILERAPFDRKALPSGNGDRTQLNGLRVWIVDDQPTGRIMLKTLLELKGAEVTALASAYDVLQKLNDSTPEVLIADIGMPGMDGYALIREIRAREAEHGENIPAIAQSGYASSEDRERALAAGYQIHIAKPADVNELIRAIESLVASRSQSASR
jgi:CheY-like chemotaxis protein